MTEIVGPSAVDNAPAPLVTNEPTVDENNNLVTEKQQQHRQRPPPSSYTTSTVTDTPAATAKGGVTTILPAKEQSQHQPNKIMVPSTTSGLAANAGGIITPSPFVQQQVPECNTNNSVNNSNNQHYLRYNTARNNNNIEIKQQDLPPPPAQTHHVQCYNNNVPPMPTSQQQHQRPPHAVPPPPPHQYQYGAPYYTSPYPHQQHQGPTHPPLSAENNKINTTTRATAAVDDSNNKVTNHSANDEDNSTPKQLFSTDDQEEKKEDDVVGRTNSRYSKRERKSTIVHINGHAVLKQNNYEVKGLGYVYGNNNTNDAIGNKPKKMKPPSQKTATATSTGVKKQRITTPSETKRNEHNSSIQKKKIDTNALRLKYLSSNLTILQPFISDKVRANLKNHQQQQEQGEENINNDNNNKQYMQPDIVKADLRDYQLDGLNWMISMHKKQCGMILGDEMGLGKTLQTISLLCHLKETGQASGPSLVICPLSVLYSWCNEIKKWAPTLNFLRFHSSCEQERELQKKQLFTNATDYDIIVTTYEMAKQATLKSLWSRLCFNYLVLDEGHKIKSADSQISQGVRKVHCYNRLILTGTPMQNNLVELWSLLNFLYPDIFVSSEHGFDDAFNLIENVIDTKMLQQANTLLNLFMIRRLKDQVEKLMPKKIETKVICPLSTTQIWWYKAILMKDISLLASKSSSNTSTEEDEEEQAKKISHAQRNVLNNLIMQLRKCCLHPYLFDGAEVDIGATTLEDLISASGKLAVLDKLLRSLYQKKHRVVLFSQFTSILDVIEDYCDMRGWHYCRFDGSTARAKRNYIVNDFNKPNSEKFIFLMSTRSGGMGLNLQTADTCILYDSDWNPQPDLQAMARVHRIGQKKTVHVYRLVCGGTIEERVVERAEKKLFLDKMVNRESSSSGREGEEFLSGDNSDSSEMVISKKDLLSTLKFGCDAVFGEDSENKNCLPTDEDIEHLTDRNRTESTSDGKLLKGGVTSKASDFETDRKLTNSTNFGGIDFKKIRDEYQKKKKAEIGHKAPKDLGAISNEWMKIQKEQQKRKRKSRIVLVNGDGSGYGAKSVPVLASNNYELEMGESSVFDRELSGTNKGKFKNVKPNRAQRSGIDFEEQDMCQVCGDGGELLCCPSCPVCVHGGCVGVKHSQNFLRCPHHRCSKCGKNSQAAGGILFPCQSCPLAWCEDCLDQSEPGFRMLGRCDRFEELGFNSTKHTAYIHCSKRCEDYAIAEFGWKLPDCKLPDCPPPMDVSGAFGSKIDDTLEVPEEEQTGRPRRSRKVVNYALHTKSEKVWSDAEKSRLVQEFRDCSIRNVSIMEFLNLKNKGKNIDDPNFLSCDQFRGWVRTCEGGNKCFYTSQVSSTIPKIQKKEPVTIVIESSSDDEYSSGGEDSDATVIKSIPTTSTVKKQPVDVAVRKSNPTRAFEMGKQLAAAVVYNRNKATVVTKSNPMLAAAMRKQPSAAAEINAVPKTTVNTSNFTVATMTKQPVNIAVIKRNPITAPVKHQPVESTFYVIFSMARSDASTPWGLSLSYDYDKSSLTIGKKNFFQVEKLMKWARIQKSQPTTKDPNLSESIFENPALTCGHDAVKTKALLDNDMIVSINGKTIREFKSFQEIISYFQQTNKLLLILRRSTFLV